MCCSGETKNNHCPVVKISKLKVNTAQSKWKQHFSCKIRSMYTLPWYNTLSAPLQTQQKGNRQVQKQLLANRVNYFSSGEIITQREMTKITVLSLQILTVMKQLKSSTQNDAQQSWIPYPICIFTLYEKTGLFRGKKHNTPTRAALKPNSPTIPIAQPQKHSQGWIKD